jgi:hypothetical protein
MGSEADRIAAELEREVETTAKALVLAIVANLIASTPVDTGWARANWIPSIGEPSDAVAGSYEAVSASDQQRGQAAVLAYVLANGALWIANNVDYVLFLNYGTSQQQPAGWIERAIDQGLMEIESERGVTGLRAAYQNEAGGQAAANLASAYLPEGL